MRFKKEGSPFTNFDKFDFTGIRQFADRLREDKRNLSEEEKEQNKKQKEEMNRNFGFAIVDGKL